MLEIYLRDLRAVSIGPQYQNGSAGVLPFSKARRGIMEYEIRYLESFDSIRAGWRPGLNVAADEARAQACIETMVSLAFGRDIVIQQSYALDSLAFQQVLGDVASAYERLSNSPESKEYWAKEKLPIRLHLHEQTSFARAAADVFARIGSGQFHSQMYPELSGQPEALVISKELVSGGGGLRLIEFLGGDERGELFQKLWAWFGTSVKGEARRIVDPAPESRSDIDRLLAPIFSEKSTLAGVTDWEERLGDALLAEVISALRVLAKSSGRERPFQSRSPLYSPRPWGESGGPSAGELVGAALPLVQEVVSTLYNRTTVASIGRASAYYSTPISSSAPPADMLKVQELALASAAVAKAGAQPKGGPGIYVGLPANPPMEVTIDSREGVRGSFNRKLGPTSENAVAAFESILQLRQEPRWQQGIAAMDEAYFGGDFDGYVSAVNSHLDVVSRGVGRHLAVRIDKSGQMFSFVDPSEKGATLSAVIAENFTGVNAQVVGPLAQISLDLVLGWIAERRALRSEVKEIRQAWTDVVIPPRREP